MLSILVTSCATLFNQPHTSVTVHTTEPSTIIHKYDTVNTVNNRAHFGVERKNEPMLIVAITDSLTKSVEIKAKNSSQFWANAYGGYFSVVGFAIDWNNPKRYTYPKRVYINSADTINRYYRYYGKVDYKGGWNLHLSLPTINYLVMMPENESAMTQTKFWGLTVGVDYYHSKDQFVNLSVSEIVNISMFQTMLLLFDEERITSNYVSISNNHRLGRQFTVGYGLSYARNTRHFNPSSYRRDDFDNFAQSREKGKKGHNALGFIFPAYFQTGEYFNIGLIYRPTFYRPELSNKFANEHLISIDLAWKIRLNR